MRVECFGRHSVSSSASEMSASFPADKAIDDSLPARVYQGMNLSVERPPLVRIRPVCMDLDVGAVYGVPSRS